ncbi:MAG: CYTH domain-containing protein [Bacteroidetes bacterium]|nr:CYTH domain-containing protein [Bacteroidota bacterium]
MKEIERKFLVTSGVLEALKNLTGDTIQQGYLSVDSASTIRVRIRNEKAYLTIKSKTVGITRDEYEYEIPLAEARQLMLLCQNKVLDKTRYIYKFEGKTWEIDVFNGRHKDLILAEVELESETEQITLPHWIGEEVSLNKKYFNSSLSLE